MPSGPLPWDEKNRLFSNTPRGAHASAVIYRLVESARANKLDPYKYLRYLENLSALDQGRDDLRKFRFKPIILRDGLFWLDFLSITNYYCYTLQGVAMAKVLNYQNTETIIQAGAYERRMYIILDGQVIIYLTDGKTREEVATLKKGDFFGEISLFNNTPRSASAIADGTVKLATIDSVEQLKEFLIKNPAFAAKMVHMLAKRLAKTDEILLGKISEINRLKLSI